MSRAVVLAGLAIVAGCLADPALPAGAEGPWRGQVVDAASGQPLPDVVVLAVWETISPGVVHQARRFHDVDEVVTDAEGRFVLPARDLTLPNPFVTIDGPHLTMFKGGYGHWRFQQAWLSRAGDPPPKFDEAMKLFGSIGAVFSLGELKTRQERIRALPSPPFGVPDSKMPTFLRALRQDRVNLGLSP